MACNKIIVLDAATNKKDMILNYYYKQPNTLRQICRNPDPTKILSLKAKRKLKLSIRLRTLKLAFLYISAKTSTSTKRTQSK